MAAFVAKLEVANNTVYPSGLALATMPARMAPPAPPRLSMTTGCPRRSAMFLAMSRAMLSVPPPAEKGTIMVIGRLGETGCAASVRGGRAIRAMSAPHREIFMMGLSRVVGARRPDRMAPYDESSAGHASL